MKCPYCNYVAPDGDLHSEMAHMSFHHPQVIEERLREAGFEKVEGAWVDRMTDLKTFEPSGGPYPPAGSMVKAGRHTIVPDDIDCHCFLEIGSFCSIAAGLVIVSGQHPGVENARAVSNFPFKEHGWGEYPPSKHEGKVVVGNDVWIGQNVTLLDGVEVSDGAVIGAGAVVSRHVRPYAVVVGNPAKEVKRRFANPTIDRLLELAWWDWDDETIKERLHELADVRTFTSWPTR